MQYGDELNDQEESEYKKEKIGAKRNKDKKSENKEVKSAN
jgi:hypothetical protein